MTVPDFSFEKPIWEKGFSILGIDEAGRGAFAGPLSVGGVVFEKDFVSFGMSLGINDSKLLSPKKREELYKEIKNHALFYGVEFIDLDTINSLGIGKATFVGMQRIYEKASKTLENVFCMVDAFKIPDVLNQKAIVHGDRLSVSIAAASILAKVERDNLMQLLGKEFPNYGFEIHKGYGTLHHRNALRTHGASIHHRRQFISKYI